MQSFIVFGSGFMTGGLTPPPIPPPKYLMLKRFGLVRVKVLAKIFSEGSS